MADYLTIKGETIDSSRPVRYVDPVKYWKDRNFVDCTFKPLPRQLFKDVQEGDLSRETGSQPPWLSSWRRLIFSSNMAGLI